MSVATSLSRLKPGGLKFARTVSGLAAIAALVAFGTLGYNLGVFYYWLMLTALAPAMAYGALRRALPLAEARLLGRKRWKALGSTVERVTYTEGQFEKLRDQYSEWTRDESRGYVDDRTWSDLGIDEIHQRIDVCFTMAGRNELYRTLRHVLPQERDFERRVEIIDRFAEDKSHREQVGRALAGVGEERDADPAVLLWSESVSADKLFPLFVAMSCLAVACIVIAAAVNVTLGLIGIGVTFFSNMWIYYRKARYLSIYIPALRVLSRMVDAASRIPWFGLPELGKEAAGAKRAFALLLTGAPKPTASISGDITEVLFLYLKIYFQIDLIAYNRIIQTIEKKRDSYRELYQRMGSVDAFYALASYRERRKKTCRATVTAASWSGARGWEAQARTAGDRPGSGADSPVTRQPNGVVLEEGYHPLIPKAVANTVTLHPPGAIVTGTNMAGKSTFLRTVGINVIFAQTAGFAFAAGYSAPRFRVMSSIEKHDDLAEGKSFYYDEAERIYTMIEEAQEEVPVLLLIDELLSGTNSLERESASVAILHYLAGRPALTVAATHDVAIARGVADKYALHYFTDSASETGLTFDYKIHEGVVATRNAIELLRLIGYPEDVIVAALERTRDA